MYIHVKEIKVEIGGHPRTKCVTSLLFSGEVIAGLQSKWVLQKRGACPACPSTEQQQHGGACIWKRILQSLELGPDGDELWRKFDNNKRIKKLQYLCLFFPTTFPRSVQRGGGGQLNKLRRMGIL
jgi:hypothetical protein